MPSRKSAKRVTDSGSETAGRLEVVVADKLDSKVTMWPKFNTSIQDFEAINKAARWDYQRDRIYIRTDAELKKAKRKKKGPAKRAVHISKIVVCEPLPPAHAAKEKEPRRFG